MRIRSAVLVVALLAQVACSRGAGDEVTRDPATCEMPFVVPAAFELREEFEDPYPDHVGIRRDFRDERGRELHTFAGIPGEFGEGLPGAGTVELVGGGSVTMFGGPHDVWVLVWHEGDECDPRVVLGNGFEREGFVDVLEGGGVVSEPT